PGDPGPCRVPSGRPAGATGPSGPADRPALGGPRPLGLRRAAARSALGMVVPAPAPSPARPPGGDRRRHLLSPAAALQRVGVGAAGAPDLLVAGVGASGPGDPAAGDLRAAARPLPPGVGAAGGHAGPRAGAPGAARPVLAGVRPAAGRHALLPAAQLGGLPPAAGAVGAPL